MPVPPLLLPAPAPRTPCPCRCPSRCPVPTPTPAPIPEAPPTPALPNLVVRFVETPSAPVTPGDVLAIGVEIANRGGTPARRVKVSLRLVLGGKERILDQEESRAGVSAGGSGVRRLRAEIPADARPGRAILRVIADPDRTVAEADESDNVAEAPIEIRPAPGAPVEEGRRGAVHSKSLVLGRAGTHDPDREPSPRARRSRTAGRTPAPAFEVVLVLSTRSGLGRPEAPRPDGADRRIAEPRRRRRASPASRFRPGWSPEPTALASSRDASPAGLRAGRYYVHLLVNPSEYGPAGVDVPSLAAPLTIDGAAVLRVAEPGLALDRQESFPGETFAVAASLVNDGNEPSMPGIAGPGGRTPGPRARTNLGTVIVALPLDPVRPGEARQVSLTTALPPTARHGRQRLVLRHVVPGTDPVDLAEATIAVRAMAPGLDLVAYEGRVSPSRARAGEAVRVRVRVASLGDGGSPATTARLELAAALGPVALGTGDVTALRARGVADIVLDGRLPRTTPAGKAWLAVRLDPDGRLPQTDRENDVTWVSVDVAGRFDADVDARWAQPVLGEGEALRPGRPLDVRTRIENTGAGPLEDAEVEGVLVSSTGALRSLGRRPLGGTVPAGGGADWTERFTLPADLAPGAYRLRLVADPDGRLPWAAAARRLPRSP